MIIAESTENMSAKSVRDVELIEIRAQRSELKAANLHVKAKDIRIAHLRKELEAERAKSKRLEAELEILREVLSKTRTVRKN